MTQSAAVTATAQSDQTETAVLRRPSQQMRAVLKIFGADPHLMRAVCPYCDFENDSIRWEDIHALPLSSGHRSAVNIAYAIWTDQPRPEANFFEETLNLEASIQRGILRALSVRWGLTA